MMTTVSATIILLAAIPGCQPLTARISMAEYEDKVYASWLGQCIGNLYGLPHASKYKDEPRTEPITDWSPEISASIRKFNGAYSNDDTDIEYVMMHCMEKYGPDPNYEQIAEFWKRHINGYIWLANRSARDLMEQGYLPPLTGRRSLNPHWDQIDSQSCCEIWAVTAPGMTDYAAAKADWAARVTNDDYSTHPTIWYNTMYAAAFFEADVHRLCRIGYEHLPANSIFREVIDDVRSWKTSHGDDWGAVRKKIKEKYRDGQGLREGISTGDHAAIVNGALGVLALLYGDGDLEKTMNYACMAGYDADHRCATLAGLLALSHGSKAIPRKFTHIVEDWSLPFNDYYRNGTRDDLPDGRITDMASRTARVGRQLVLAHGGRIEQTMSGERLVIDCRARFVAPLEIRLFPTHVEVGKQVTIQTEIIGGDPQRGVDIVLAGTLPPGLRMKFTGVKKLLTGVPTTPGRYVLSATVSDETTIRETALTLFVREAGVPANQSQPAENGPK